MNCVSVLKRSKATYTSYTTSAFDCFCVGYCVTVSNCTWELDFSLSGLGPEVVEMLLYGLRSKEEVRGSIDVLNLCRNRIGKEGLAHLREMPHKILQELSHLESELDSAALDVLSDVIPITSTLKYLNISGNLAQGDRAAKCLQSLSTASHLRTLALVNVFIDYNEISHLSHLVVPSGNLKELLIDYRNIKQDCMKLLLKTVISPSSLEYLVLWGMDLSQ